jgi:hypothetical protein
MMMPVADRPHDRLIIRRNILIGAAASLICAPAIVRVASLMPVRRLPRPFGPQHAGFVERLMYQSLASNLRTGRMTTNLNGAIIPEAAARRMVARAQDYGWLPPYISIYRKSEGGFQARLNTSQMRSSPS